MSATPGGYPVAMKRVPEPHVEDSAERAEAYDAKDFSTVNHAFARRLLELGAKGRVLDIACGPGHVALQLVAISSKVQVVGVDSSQHMLDIAEEHREVSSHAERVEFQVADANQLPFEDGSFQAVCSKSSLHHMDDPLTYLQEAWRVTEVGGVLLIRDHYRPETMAEAEALVEKYGSDRNASGKATMLAGFCAAYTPDELIDLAREAGLQGAELEIDNDRHMSLQVAAIKAD